MSTRHQFDESFIAGIYMRTFEDFVKVSILIMNSELNSEINVEEKLEYEREL